MIEIRPADAGDSRTLFDWRNDPVTRASSVSTDEVAWSDHETWIANTLGSHDHAIYVAELSGVPIGVVRFDSGPDRTDVSINLSPLFRGRGLGPEVLAAAIAEYDATTTTPMPLSATIRTENNASIRLFSTLGFVEVGRDGDFLRYARPAPVGA
jgi:L-amino acid N-acyltransferase YncA